MKSFAAVSDWPLLVYTNSWRDYAITVRSGSIDRDIELRVMDRLAPAFAPVVASPSPRFETAIGVAGLPGRPDELLAFRVFDVGSYQGRPHTLGIVALIVAQRPPPIQSLSALLASLSPPTPDRGDYVVTTPLLNAAPPSEPWARLVAWERRGELLGINQVELFCEPVQLTPSIDWGEQGEDTGMHSDRANRRRWISYVLAMLGLALAGIGLWFLVGRDQEPGVNASPHPSPVTLDDGHERDQLRLVLVPGKFVTDEDFQRASTPSLMSLAVRAEQRARDNLSTAAPDMGRNLESSADIRAGVFEELIEKWKSQSWMDVDPIDNRPSKADYAKALRFLRVYRDLLQEAAKLRGQSDRQAFDEFLAQVERALKTE